MAAAAQRHALRRAQHSAVPDSILRCRMPTRHGGAGLDNIQRPVQLEPIFFCDHDAQRRVRRVVSGACPKADVISTGPAYL